MIHPAKPVSAIRTIRTEGIFDAWYDFGSWARLNAVFTFFSNAKYKIGFKTKGQHRHYVYDEFALHSDSSHEYQNYKKLLLLTGITGNSLPELTAGEKPGNKNDIVIIHMFPGGSRSYLKEWDDGKWAGVINHITDMNYSVYLTGAPKDRERALNIFNRINNKNLVFLAAGEYDLRRTIDLIASAGLVITVDTGILHIASAAGANLIALHGPTSCGRWGALNWNSISFESGLDCAPCISLGFESRCKNNRCMKEISVENILNAVIKFIPERQVV
jgi:heptosyltransferase I